MKHVESITELRALRERLEGTVAFVPTLGFLHQGHLALMQRGLDDCDHLIVSVFVNPTQFGPDEDLDEYPRDTDGDAAKCRDTGCDIFFTPSADDIYPPGDNTRVTVDDLTDALCGASRPNHFQGVTDVVGRLFNIVDPDVAVFGRKDFQQLAVIRRMTRDLHFDIDIVAVDTVREDDGLATSSRNRYLDDDQRRQATCLSRGLVAARRLYVDDPSAHCADILRAARQPIDDQPDTDIDYVQCVDPDTIAPLDGDAPVGDNGAVVAMAVTIGDARLIDNIRLDRPLPAGLDEV